ncbi:cholesterol 24-hydroxylase-like [Pelobates cultripes]|uniref:Cholesterol 24-hydroxylase-like n=1 Tax=Pelobates cultripes TaxID=61616 RepID=A0AAD1S0D7_PELCU|nr:cholesterol 24-hydroxylase-like [Pelobates cultripes]
MLQWLSWAQYVLLLLVVVIIGLFLAYCAYVHYQHLKYDHIPGPPRDSFLLGHVPSLNKAGANYKVIHDLFLQWAEEYGSIFRINALHRVMIYSTSPESIKVY